MAKIMENKDAAEALKVTEGPRFAAAGAQVPKGLGKKQEAAEAVPDELVDEFCAEGEKDYERLQRSRGK